VIIETQSARDGIVEAIRWDGPSYVFGMQWHPEFLAERQYSDCQMDGSPIVWFPGSSPPRQKPIMSTAKFASRIVGITVHLYQTALMVTR
jgi:hypothetical protein